MNITGEQTIAATPQLVWDALNNPEILKRCLPGCESVENSAAGEFLIVMAAAVGPLRARFKGTLRMTEAKPPESCVMVFQGEGGAVGFGKGSSTVSLTAVAGGTELEYTAKAEIGGKLAQVGSRLVESVARKLSDDFFKALRQQLSPAPLASVPAHESVPSTTPRDTEGAGFSVDRLAGTAGPPEAAIEAEASAAAMVMLAGATAPASQSEHTNSSARSVLVPGWWLLVAAAFGSLASLAGGCWLR